MDKFTPYLPPFQFIDSHFPALLDSLLASHSFRDLSFTPFHTLSPFFHDPLPLPPHPYICASSAFSAVVQLYARSAQLPTNILLASRSRGLVIGPHSAVLAALFWRIPTTPSSASAVQPLMISATSTPGHSSWTHPTLFVGLLCLPLSAPTLITLSPTFSKMMIAGPSAPPSFTWGFSHLP